MPDIVTIIQGGAANPWVYLPAALTLGALHALEPGHSKSLMAAFIVAIRGTVRQAALLGVSAAIGHTIVVWGLALLGLYLGDKLILERAEPWLILISGLLVIGLALRLLTMIHDENILHHAHNHDHGHDHGHDHDRHHDHDHGDLSGLSAHDAGHAREIVTRFANRKHVGNAEIAWFGFTGGLLPCPAAIAVLLICLQLKKVTLGVAMVAAFSAGLAVTLVAVGVTAAWGARRAQTWTGFGGLAERLPYISGALVLALGIFITARGIYALAS